MNQRINLRLFIESKESAFGQKTLEILKGVLSDVSFEQSYVREYWKIEGWLELFLSFETQTRQTPRSLALKLFPTLLVGAWETNSELIFDLERSGEQCPTLPELRWLHLEIEMG